MFCVLCFSGCGGGQAVWERLVDEWNVTTGEEKNVFDGKQYSVQRKAVDASKAHPRLMKFASFVPEDLKRYP